VRGCRASRRDRPEADIGLDPSGAQ